MEELQKNTTLGERSVNIPLKQIRMLTNKLSQYSDETLISLELVLTALFPTVFENVKAYGSDCYMKGYLQGKKDQ